MMQMPNYRMTKDQAIERERAFGTPVPPDDELLPDEPEDELERVIREAMCDGGDEPFAVHQTHAALAERIARALHESHLVMVIPPELVIAPDDPDCPECGAPMSEHAYPMLGSCPASALLVPE